MDAATARAAIDRSRAALGAAENEAIRARGIADEADGDDSVGATLAIAYATLALQATIAAAVDLFLRVMEEAGD